MDEIAADALGSVRAGVDALLSGDLDSLSSVELTTLLAELEVQRRRLESVDQRVLAAIGERGVAGEYARSSTVDLLVHLLHVSPQEAEARAHRAADMGPAALADG
jgi:Domain of unknown function (DUF222)